MRHIVLLTLWVTAVLLTSVFAQGQTIRRDPIFSDRWNIYENGERQGYIKKDFLFDNKYNVYDKSGIKKGHWKKDFLNDEEWHYVDER